MRHTQLKSRSNERQPALKIEDQQVLLYDPRLDSTPEQSRHREGIEAMRESIERSTFLLADLNLAS